MSVSNRKKLATLLRQQVALQAQIDEVKPLADAEPEEFDGASVVVGSNVVIEVKKDKVVSEVVAQVVAIKKAADGVKGPGTLIKVQTGEGFDLETRVVYPAQILRYAPIRTADVSELAGE